MSDDVASEVIAKYAVTGPRTELERTLPLEPGEVLIACAIAHTSYGDGPFVRGRRGFVRLSTRRLCIVRHYGFIRDRIIVIPAEAITSVEGQGLGDSVHITYCAVGGDRVITVVNWRAPTAPIDHAMLGSRDLHKMLRDVVLALWSATSDRR